MTTPLEWTALHRPTAENLAKVTESLMELHGDDWDSPHHLAMWGVADDGTLLPLVMNVIMPNVDTEDMPKVFAELMARAVADPDLTAPITILTFQHEGWMLIGDAEGWTDDQQTAIDTGTVHQHPDRREVLATITVGVGGGMHMVSLERDTGRTSTHTTAQGCAPHGPFARYLMSMAEALPEMFILRGLAEQLAAALDDDDPDDTEPDSAEPEEMPEAAQATQDGGEL
jgi:hypothetical protein